MTEKFKIINDAGDYHLMSGDEKLGYDLCSPSMMKNNWNKVVDKLNKQDERIKELEKENRGLQFKIIDMLDFVKEKGTVTREEIKKWWNGGMAEKRYKRLVSSIDYYYCIDTNDDKGLTEEDMLNRLNEQEKEIQRLKLIINGLNYALKNIRQIDVEIDLNECGDVE